MEVHDISIIRLAMMPHGGCQDQNRNEGCIKQLGHVDRSIGETDKKTITGVHLVRITCPHDTPPLAALSYI